MSWVQENKFLTAVIAVTVIGSGALGYLLFDAMGKNSAASEEFDRVAAEKKRLETMPVYPNEANLRKVQEQKQEHLARIQDLQKKLKSMELPEEPLSPEAFQDRLRVSVTAYLSAAAGARLKLPDKFYMGFDTYQSSPPKAEAAPKLGRQLKAIEFALGQLVANRAVELRGVIREELPEETGRPRVQPAAAKPAAPGAKKPEAAPLVEKHAFEITFLSDQTAAQKVLNAIDTDRKQFYITRTVVVRNEKPTPPPREAGSVPPPPAADTPPPAPEAAAPNPAAPAPPPTATAAPVESAAATFQFIVGEERIESTLLVEVAEFAPAEVEKAGGKGKTQK
jgi:hypothetical protein